MSPASRWAFLIDENTSRTLVAALRANGYSAEHVYEAGLQGHPDTDVFAYAQAHQQSIITADLGFANIIDYPPPHYGIMVLRIPDTISTTDLVQEVLNALKILGGQDLKNNLFIIQPGRVRKRSS